MKKVVITGASGLLGRAIMKEFESAGDYEVVGTAFSRSGEKYRKVDLTSPAQLDEFLSAETPDVIIHSAAHRFPDICENDPQATLDLNVEATRQIARYAKKTGALMIYISTDYVFDGTNPPYQPGDTTNPLNAYGQSKLAGEIAMREMIPDSSVVLRVPILYGPCEKLAESAATSIAETLLEKMKDTTTVAMDDWAIRRPTLVSDVAVCCREIVEYRSQHDDLAGIFHFSGNEPMTKYEMAMKFAEIVGFPAERLTTSQPSPNAAPRPKDATLDCGKLHELGIGLHITPTQKGFADAVTPFLK